MPVRSFDLTGLSVDDLSNLYEQVRVLLAQKINEQKRKLELQLATLSTQRATGVISSGSKKEPPKVTRRPYPPVVPKYRNPADPAETWAGRGKQPRWLTAQLRAGRKIEDFRIKAKSDRMTRRA